MSRRQALGVISANNATVKVNQQATAAAGVIGKPLLKSSASYSNNNQFNDENEPPQGAVVQKTQQQFVEFEFEIFQEKEEAKKPIVVGVKKESPRQAPSNKENEEEDDEEEDEEDEEEEDDEDEEEEEEEEEDEDEENLEEEGISRLNIAAMIDDSKSSSHIINTSGSELMMVMDSSHNESPMVLDDTIKFQSLMLSKLEDDEDNGEFDDDDEETRLKIAAAERDNLLMNCLDYKDDILKYMRELEKENRSKASYMKKQQDITSSMRSILVDWLVEVSEEYKLNAETLYLAVNYTDRFLSQMSVLRGKLQLVGTASMYIAAKYEEITPPDVSEFVYITDDTYTKKQVLRMEHLLLKVLDFKMSPPTVNWFLMHYMRFIKLSTNLSQPNNNDLYQRLESLAKYLCELTLVDADTYLAYLPSQIATSAVYLAMLALGKSWPKQIADICGYTHDLVDLKACIVDLHRTMQQAPTHPQQAIQEKYKQARYDHVALIDAPRQLPAHILQ